MDLSNIDLLAVCGADTTYKRTASTEGGNYEARCPKCGDKNDFIILPEHTTINGLRRGQCFCRECHPERMDAIAYLEWARDMNTQDAMTHLRDMYGLVIPDKPFSFRKEKTSKPVMPHYRIKQLPMNATPPPDEWQARGKAAMRRSQEFMWHETIGKDARDYLHSRGLSDETIKTEGLGFVPKDEFDDPVKWGLNPKDVEKVYIPRGILFPYLFKDDLWKIRIRRFGDDIPKDKRYMMVSGSANGLYRADSIKPGSVAVMFEGELNALSIAQEVGDEQVSCVAIGSSTHARTPKWAVALSRASLTLLCFDPDGAGEEAHTYWSARLKNFKHLRLPDGRNDANDMLTAGDDLRAWLSGEGVSLQQVERCSVCGIDIATIDTAAYDHDGILFCDHYPEIHLPYCSRVKKEREMFQNETFTIESPIEPVEEVDEVRINRTNEQFMSTVNRIADVFGDCKVTVRSKKDYSLEQHIAEEHADELRAKNDTHCSVGICVREASEWTDRGEGYCELHKVQLHKRATSHWETVTVTIPKNNMAEAIDRAMWRRIREARAYVPVPSWLKPGTEEWNKQVLRTSMKEMMQRRRAWLDQKKRLNDVVLAEEANPLPTPIIV